MEILYVYVKKRSNFGQQCHFTNNGPKIVDDVLPRRELQEKYLAKNPVDKGIQESRMFSNCGVNTRRIELVDCGMNHSEGGWPQDLNVLDEESVMRYRKKLERNENYVEALRALTKPVEHAVLQNNAINIYQKYFDGFVNSRLNVEPLTQVRIVFRDPSQVSRPVSHVSWCSEGEYKVAASYCNLNFQRMRAGEETCACIWDPERPNVPQMTFDSKIPIVNLEWNPADKHLLVGGLYNGQIALYDVRRAPEHGHITKEEFSHRDPVHSVLWTHSKTACEFFSTSTDGLVKWWDCRYMNSILDMVILDISKNESGNQIQGASCLEYDPSVPAKYLVGTENGTVICGNRRGTNKAEKLPWTLKTHSGPLYAVERNAGFSKCFLTVGDWSSKIWTEDCKESAIIWTKPYRTNLSCAVWSKTRYSLFFLTRADGYLDLWDLLINQTNPRLSVKISDSPLSTARVHEAGKYLLVGDEAGRTYLIQLEESLRSSGKNDKALLSLIFERETRREKIIESRTREIRLGAKLRAQRANEEPAGLKAGEMESREEDLRKAEENYFEEVNKSLPMYEIKTHEKLPGLSLGSRDKGFDVAGEVETKLLRLLG